MTKTVTMKIKGMHCNGCALGLQGALEKLPQVPSAKVTYADRTAVLEWNGADDYEAALREAVRGAGFEVEAFQ